jgi:hypothetical protein
VNGVDEEESKEERDQELQLLYSIIIALGLAWPNNRDTQVLIIWERAGATAPLSNI